VSSAIDTEDALAGEREFTFQERDFQRVCKLIYAHAGISLSDSKRDLVYGRLARRLRSLRASSFADYLDILEDDHSPEWEHFINALTTNLTSFFREKHHFDMLAEYLRAHAGKGCLRLWSAAASTGEEAYSMAITVAQNLHRASDEVKILATDIDTNVLDRGRAGVYPADRIDGLAPELRKKYFLRGSGHNEDKVRVSEKLRAMITFRRLNLLAPQWPMKHKLDVVLCRNVLIYFDKPTQQQLMRQMADYIKPGGLLCIGHSENPPIDRHLLEPLGRTAYRVLGGRRHD